MKRKFSNFYAVLNEFLSFTKGNLTLPKQA